MTAAPRASAEPPVAEVERAAIITPLEAIRLLRRIAAREAGLDEDGRQFADAVARYERFAEIGETLDRAFGLVAPGRDSWWRAERREQRDNAIRELAARGLTAPKISAAIIARRRRRIAQPSLSEQDRLLDAICAGDPPTSERQILRIIMNLHDN
jgi:hypothetical protein